MNRIASALALLALFHPTLAPAADSALDELQGKWSVQKTNEEGRVYSQHLEFAQDKVTFELRREDGEIRFVAKAKVKMDKAGPLKTFTLSDIEAGRSSSELEPVHDQRSSVYTLRDGNLVIASNFDRERDNERPSIDIYKRSAPNRASSTDAMPEKLLGTWDMELTIGEDTLDYQLAIEKADGGLQATLISPRSGKHKFKSIEYKDGQLRMEIDREIEGRETTLTYRGKLTGGALAGKVTAEGFEQGADWRATK